MFHMERGAGHCHGPRLVLFAGPRSAIFTITGETDRNKDSHGNHDKHAEKQSDYGR